MVMDGVVKKDKTKRAVTNRGAERGRLRAQDLKARTKRKLQGCSGISVMRKNKSNSRGGVVDAVMTRKKPEPTEEKKRRAARWYRHPPTSIYLSLQVKMNGMSISELISTLEVGVPYVWKLEGARTHIIGEGTGLDQGCQRYVWIIRRFVRDVRLL